MSDWTPLAVCLTAGAAGLFLLRRQIGALGRLLAVTEAFPDLKAKK